MRIAVIVPTLDEESAVQAHLAGAFLLGDEVIVSDGGSRDQTVESAVALGAVVVSGAAGRGPQLNRAAAATEAEILVFLHADTILPAGARQAICQAIQAGAEGGGFLMRFSSAAWFPRLSAGLINARSRLTGLALGDQVHFVRREVFRELGGYPAWPILEDLDFFRRLKARGKTVLLPGPVTTSARRYESRGWLPTILRNWTIWLLFALGVSPFRLARLYDKARA